MNCNDTFCCFFDWKNNAVQHQFAYNNHHKNFLTFLS